MVKRSFAWAARFRRLAKDYERLPKTMTGLHFMAFACFMLNRAVTTLDTGSRHPLETRALSSGTGPAYVGA